MNDIMVFWVVKNGFLYDDFPFFRPERELTDSCGCGESQFGTIERRTKKSRIIHRIEMDHLRSIQRIYPSYTNSNPLTHNYHWFLLPLSALASLIPCHLRISYGIYTYWKELWIQLHAPTHNSLKAQTSTLAHKHTAATYGRNVERRASGFLLRIKLKLHIGIHGHIVVTESKSAPYRIMNCIFFLSYVSIVELMPLFGPILSSVELYISLNINGTHSVFKGN